MMTAVLHWHRAYFLVVMGFTLWVGYIGFAKPLEILRALPWPLPPLHARFVGALYLSASLFLLLSIGARSVAQVRAIVVIALVWTGWLLLVTLLHWQTFDFARRQVWFWVFAYFTFPVAALLLLARGRSARTGPRRPLSSPAVLSYLRLVGTVLSALALLCFAYPQLVVAVWPWKISAFIAQVYSGPLLGYGVGHLMLARGRDWTSLLLPSVGLTCFALLALAASWLHWPLFTPGAPATIGWVISLALLSIGSGWTSLLALRQSSGGSAAR